MQSVRVTIDVDPEALLELRSAVGSQLLSMMAVRDCFARGSERWVTWDERMVKLNLLLNALVKATFEDD